MNISKDRKAKLESAYSFMLKYSKITVCTVTSIFRSRNVSYEAQFYFYQLPQHICKNEAAGVQYHPRTTKILAF